MSRKTPINNRYFVTLNKQNEIVLSSFQYSLFSYEIRNVGPCCSPVRRRCIFTNDFLHSHKVSDFGDAVIYKREPDDYESIEVFLLLFMTSFQKLSGIICTTSGKSISMDTELTCTSRWQSNLQINAKNSTDKVLVFLPFSL